MYFLIPKNNITTNPNQSQSGNFVTVLQALPQSCMHNHVIIITHDNGHHYTFHTTFPLHISLQIFLFDVVTGAMDAAVVVAEATHRQQLHTIKAAALVNLTYLQLQQQQWQQAVVYSQQLLQVPQPRV